jgi:hypothetical protein
VNEQRTTNTPATRFSSPEIPNPMAFLAPITIPWNYVPNALGPIISPTDTGFSITRPSGTGGTNQQTNLALPNITLTNGFSLAFGIEYDKIAVRPDFFFSNNFIN